MIDGDFFVLSLADMNDKLSMTNERVMKYSDFGVNNRE